MRLSLIKPVVLCIALGPLGLISYHWQYAIVASLITAMSLLSYNDHALWIWLFAIISSAITAILILKNNLKREKIDNFLPSRYIGTVSCKVVSHHLPGRPQKDRFASVLRKHRLRRRLNKSIDATIAVLCVSMIYAVMTNDAIERPSTGNNHSKISDLIDGKHALPTQQQASRLDSTSKGVFTVRSDNMLRGNNGHYRAELHINCHNNKTNLALHTVDILGTESSNISILTNNQNSYSFTWHIHEDFYTASAPMPISTLKKLQNLTELELQYRTYGSDWTTSARFNTDLINNAISGVREHCHW